jgi:hypothetical protein
VQLFVSYFKFNGINSPLGVGGGQAKTTINSFDTTRFFLAETPTGIALPTGRKVESPMNSLMWSYLISLPFRAFGRDSFSARN